MTTQNTLHEAANTIAQWLYYKKLPVAQEKIETAIVSAISLESREAYIAWRTEWKTLYKAMIHDIRAAKAFYKVNKPRADGSYETYYKSTLTLPNNRAVRSAMMLLRMEGKKRSYQAKQNAMQA